MTDNTIGVVLLRRISCSLRFKTVVLRGFTGPADWYGTRFIFSSLLFHRRAEWILMNEFYYRQGLPKTCLLNQVLELVALVDMFSRSIHTLLDAFLSWTCNSNVCSSTPLILVHPFLIIPGLKKLLNSGNNWRLQNKKWTVWRNWWIAWERNRTLWNFDASCEFIPLRICVC